MLDNCVDDNNTSDDNNERDKLIKSNLFGDSNVTKDELMLAELNLTEIAQTRNVIDVEFDSETFYGLPMKVKDILVVNRGIANLYGNVNNSFIRKLVHVMINLVFL